MFEVAIFNGNRDIAQLLHRHGADINDETPDGNTAMHMAIARQDEDLQKFLMKLKPDLTKVDSIGSTLLHEAVAGWDVHADALILGSEFSTRLLLDLDNSGIDVNATNTAGDTPLYLAASHADVGVVKLIVDAGADVNVYNNRGASPACLAAAEDYVENLKYLIHLEATLGPGPSGNCRSLLHTAAVRGQVLSLAYLLQQCDVDVDNVNSLLETALSLAINHYGYPSVPLLLEAGASVNVQTSSGDTPLRKAIYANHHASIEKLLACKPQLDVSNIEGMSPLHSAIRKGLIAVVKALLDPGANPNYSVRDNPAPFMTAVHEPSKKAIIELLIAKGADLYARNAQGIIALHFVVQAGKFKILRLRLPRYPVSALRQSDWGNCCGLNLDSSLDYETIRRTLMLHFIFKAAEQVVKSNMEKARKQEQDAKGEFVLKTMSGGRQQLVPVSERDDSDRVLERSVLSYGRLHFVDTELRVPQPHSLPDVIYQISSRRRL